jgi:heterodisulfide reductase subunit B
MKYLYYPGCTLEGTALEYNRSTQALMRALGAELAEIDDWTCCGATAAEGTSRLLSLALPARNLAKAEQMEGQRDILVPCSACYLNLKKVEAKVRIDPDLRAEINTVLAAEDLKLSGRLRVRHLLDVLATDIGAQSLRARVQKTLTGISVAPYYGCQALRPYCDYDDPEKPRSMEGLLHAIGARVFDWDMGGRCCGASHMNTKMEVGLELVAALLRAAKGADAVVTVCPMCQMNLEAYQHKIGRLKNEDLSISIIYLPQLIGLALGLSEQELRLDLNLAVTGAFRQKLQQAA